MTTIVYRDGLMACDTMVTSGGIYDGSTSKIWRVPQGVLAIAGDLAMAHEIANLISLEDGGAIREYRKTIDIEDNGFDAFLVTKETVWVYDSTFVPMPIDAPFYAEGSGRNLAIGAMAAGAKADEAVAIACQYDIRSSAPVFCVDVRTEIEMRPQEKGAELILEGIEPIHLVMRQSS